MSSLKIYSALCVVVLLTCLLAGLQGCGGGEASGGSQGPNGQPDTSVTADGEADQGCYGCILDVGKDGEPDVQPNGHKPTDGTLLSADGDVIVAGCQNDSNCTDEFDCTVDTCLPDGTCQNMPDDKLCGEGEVCDLEHDGCFKTKSCFNDEQCDDEVECTVEGCNTETNLCYPAIKDDSRCDGGFVCLPQHLEADSLSGCVEGSHCEKDADCISDILCASGQCLLDICEWTLNDASCDDNNICNGNEICDPFNGCQSIDPLVCDDQITCTKDDCLPDYVCTEEDKNDCLPDSACTHDFSLCDDNSFCNDGAGCDDGIACTKDICLVDEGICDYEIKPNFCLISGVCIIGGLSNNDNLCFVCEPITVVTAWMAKECPTSTECSPTTGECVEVD